MAKWFERKSKRKAILEVLKDAKSVIDALAERGQYFDDLERSMGLQGKIDDAILMLSSGSRPAYTGFELDSLAARIARGVLH